MYQYDWRVIFIDSRWCHVLAVHKRHLIKTWGLVNLNVLSFVCSVLCAAAPAAGSTLTDSTFHSINQ